MFIEKRQPNITPISKDVFDKLQKYLEQSSSLSDYRILHIYRKSNYMEDDYLYSVIGYNMKSGTYACWSSWNNITESLNHGHYGLLSENDAVKILKEQFNDITGDLEKYGLLSNEYDNSENIQIEKEQQKAQEREEQVNQDNVVDIGMFRRRGR